VKVYLRECTHYESVSGPLKDLLNEYSHLFKPGDRILVKPNLLSPKAPSTAVTTHPDVIKVILEFLLDMGVKPLVGDSPAVGSIQKVARVSGVKDVCEKLGVPIVELDDPVEFDGIVYRKIRLSRKVVEVDGVVNVPKLKTHSQMILTLAVKNTFGCIPGKEKSAWHLRAGANENFADLLIDVHLLVKPVLNILDGVIGMEGNGPSNGQVKLFGLIAVSEDGFAMDHAVVRSLGISEGLIYTVKRSLERGLVPPYILYGEWRGKISLPSTVPVVPLPRSIARLLRRVIRVPRIDRRKCVGCRICEVRCPVSAIDIDTGKVDYERCIRCYVCHEVCPENAINLVRRVV